MASDILTKYSAQETITAAVASLASDTNLLAGLESSIIDNSSTGYDDRLLSGKITTGTSPTASRQIEVWAIGWDGSGWPDVFDGVTSSETITSSDIKNAICKPIAIMSTNSTSDRTYWFTGVSLRQAFGGTMPEKCVLFIVHNTGAALNATAGNHAFYATGVYPQSQ
jgi:hypothetical protein